MLPLAVSGYELSLFVHITAVVVGFGATFAEALTFPVAMQLDARHLPYVHRLQLAINRYLATPALGIVLVTGIYQAADGDWDFGAPWISGSFAIVIVLGGLLGGYYIPTDRRLAALADREVGAAAAGTPVTMSSEYQAKARQEGVVGIVTGVLIVVAIFLMVVKPGA
jgi:uncharacterized membrane protein